LITTRKTSRTLLGCCFVYVSWCALLNAIEMGVGWLIVLHSRDFFNHPATKFPPQKESYSGTGCEWDDNSVEFVHGSCWCWFRLFSWLNLGLNIYVNMSKKKTTSPYDTWCIGQMYLPNESLITYVYTQYLLL
jgi:hypothetical protein